MDTGILISGEKKGEQDSKRDKCIYVLTVVLQIYVNGDRPASGK